MVCNEGIISISRHSTFLLYKYVHGVLVHLHLFFDILAPLAN